VRRQPRNNDDDDDDLIIRPPERLPGEGGGRFMSGQGGADVWQVAQFDGAMQGLTRSDRRSMWADAAVMVFLLTTPAGPVRYEADFYSTQQRSDPTTWVPWEQVEPVFVLLDGFAGVR
jgi:hypothetical protein